MERRQLEYLIAVADDRSFTRAAERLHVAQPGISTQIRRLEHELGEVLFERDGRGARTTALGDEVVRHARAVLQSFADLRDCVDEARGLLRGHVRVGMVRGAPLGALATILARFRADHPGVDLTLVEDESGDLLARLAAGDLDLALVGIATRAQPAGVLTHVLLIDRVCAVVAEPDDWSGRSEVALAEVLTRDLVALPRGTGQRAAFDQACADHRLRASVRFEAGALTTVAELARVGMGVGLMPASAIGPGSPLGAGLHRLAVVAPEIDSTLALAWRDPSIGPVSAPARALVAAVRGGLTDAG